MSKITISDCLNLLRKESWKVSKNWNVLFDDVLSEAIIIFYESLSLYDPKKGTKFSTYLTHRLRLLTASGKHGICLREYLLKIRFVDIDVTTLNSLQPDSLRFIEFMEMVKKELTEDAQFLLNFIFLRGEKISRREAKDILSGSLNWARYRVHRAWSELKIFWRCFDGSPL